MLLVLDFKIVSLLLKLGLKLVASLLAQLLGGGITKCGPSTQPLFSGVEISRSLSFVTSPIVWHPVGLSNLRVHVLLLGSLHLL